MKKFFLLFGLLSVFAMFSCENKKNEPNNSPKDLLVGNWITTPNFMDMVLNSLLENATDEEKIMLETLLKGGNIAMQLSDNGNFIMGFRSDAIALAGKMGTEDYIDVRTFDDSSMQTSMSWSLTPNNDSICLTAHIPQHTSGEAGDTMEEKSYIPIVSINETQLVLSFNMDEEMPNPIPVPFIRQTNIHFLNAKDVFGDESPFYGLPFPIKRK